MAKLLNDRFRRGVVRLLAIGAVASAARLAAASDVAPSARDADRSFQFTYAATVTGLKPGQGARVWIPVAVTDGAQQVRVVDQNLPTAPQATHDAKYGNSMLYFAAPASSDGSIRFSTTYAVTRRVVGEMPAGQAGDAHPDSFYLQPDALVPVGGKPATLLDGLALPADGLGKARAIYGLVDYRMQYRKDKPGWGRGDAVWACQSRFGNCTDFDALFISLLRTERIPSRIEFGFTIPTKTGTPITSYHCWAWLKPQGHEWIPTDISLANQHPEKRDFYFGHLDANRVSFTTGRDLVLAPPQDGPPVNFFIYPYVEVDGKPFPAEKVKLNFSFANSPDQTAPGSPR